MYKIIQRSTIAYKQILNYKLSIVPTVQKHTEQLVNTFEQFISGLSLMEMAGKRENK